MVVLDGAGTRRGAELVPGRGTELVPDEAGTEEAQSWYRIKQSTGSGEQSTRSSGVPDQGWSIGVSDQWVVAVLD
jgi:hypothetical protein